MTDETTHLDYLNVDVPNSGYNRGFGTPELDWAERYRTAFRRIDNDIETGGNAPLTTSAFINVAKPPYSAPENGNGDATPAVQQAIDDLPADGGTLFFPYMVRIESTLDATNRRNIRWTTPMAVNDAEASHAHHTTAGINAKTDGAPVIDTTGSFCFVFESGFAIKAPLGTGKAESPNIGVLMARSDSQDHPPGHDFEGVRFYGDFHLSCIYSVSKELCSIRDSYLVNSNHGGSLILHSTDNHENITSQFATINPIATATQWFYASNSLSNYGTGPGVRIRGFTAGHYFLGNYWRSERGDMVELDTGEQNMLGPYAFWHPRLEAGVDAGAFVHKTGGQTLDGLEITGGRFTGGQQAVDLRGTGSVRNFYFKDAPTGFESQNAGILAGDLEFADIQCVGGATVEVGTLTDSRVYLLAPSATLTVSGAITGSDVRTHISDNQFRHDLTQGRIRFEPRSTAPLSPEQGDVLMQDGVGWNPTGSGSQELVTFDGTNWVSA